MLKDILINDCNHFEINNMMVLLYTYYTQFVCRRSTSASLDRFHKYILDKDHSYSMFIAENIEICVLAGIESNRVYCSENVERAEV